MTDHRKTLIMKYVRNALDMLQRKGVGYVDLEHTDEIHYTIDGKVFVVSVKDGDTNG